MNRVKDFFIWFYAPCKKDHYILRGFLFAFYSCFLVAVGYLRFPQYSDFEKGLYMLFIFVAILIESILSGIARSISQK